MQVVAPDQSVIEKRLNRVMMEFTDLFVLKFKSIDLVDEDIQSRINDRYLRTEVITPNEVRSTLGLPERTDGDEPLPFPTKKEKTGPGAPFGNSNNDTIAPRNARADSEGQASDPRQTGDQAERGQNQDNSGGTE
jgi:hypothetical protein